MRNLRSYYSAPITEFLWQSDSEILGIIHTNDISAETTIQQSNTWEAEIRILKSQLQDFTEGRIIFEYTIPRMGKRVDVVLLHKPPLMIQISRCIKTKMIGRLPAGGRVMMIFVKHWSCRSK